MKIATITALLLFAAGCTTDAERMEEAFLVCANNGGLNWYRSPSRRVRCNDGASYDLDWRRTREAFRLDEEN